VVVALVVVVVVVYALEHRSDHFPSKAQKATWQLRAAVPLQVNPSIS
jgi:hypothetical protein